MSKRYTNNLIFEAGVGRSGEALEWQTVHRLRKNRLPAAHTEKFLP